MAMLMFPWTHWASQKVVMYQENTCSLHEVSASGHKAYLMYTESEWVCDPSVFHVWMWVYR